jgi:integrase
MKLTETVVSKLECPADKKDILVFDDVQRGLAVRVSCTGGKTYLAQYTFGSSKRRIPLGAPTLALARSAAAKIMGEVAKGLDPAADRKAATLEARRKAAHEALTLDALLDQWSALRLADKRASYAAEAVRAIKVAFPKQLPLPAADLDRATVVRVLDNLTKAGKPAMAARTAAYARACFQWAMRRGSIATNPFVNLPVAPTVRRDRVLTDAELRAIWQATAKPGSFNSIVRMLMLTAQRRDEVADMAWSELSGDLSIWTIPASRAKNGQDSIVPLAPQAQAILEATPRYKGNPLVFPGDRGAFSGWSKSKERLDRESGVKDWRLHDLRRTAATGLQKLGVRLEVTEAVLNHIAGSGAGIVGIYQKYGFADEKRAALAAWGERVAAIVEGREPGDNVTPIRAKSA